MAHWPDVGGTLGGVTTDIFSEGLQIPIVKYARAGVVNQEIREIIRMNVRLPDRAMGDLRAQITAIKTGERRFLELLDRYGREPCSMHRSTSWITPKPRRASARERFPTASTKPSRFMDDDGVEIGTRIPIRVKVDRIGRRDDRRSDRRRQAGARLLQFRSDHRASPARRSRSNA